MNRLNNIKKVTLGLIIFLISSVLCNASWGGKFHSVQDSGKKVVNFGPCYVGDQIFTGFVMKNTGTETVRVIDVAPSIVFFNSPTALTQFEYLRFFNYSPVLPIMLKPAINPIDTLMVQYFADSDTSQASLGRKEALFQIGFVKPSDTTEIVAIDTFKLITKKTRKFIDGYDDVIAFDSIYINPAYPIEYQWKVKNTQTKSYDLVRQKDTLYSRKLMGDEFVIENKLMPLTLTNKTYFVPWTIYYSPKDEGTDTAGIFLYFKPYPVKYPDSLEFCKTKIIGTGVRQNLVIESADFNFTTDTLFLGDLPVSETKRFRISLTNTGNLPYGVQSQSFRDKNDADATEFSFIKKFLDDKSNLRKNAIDSCVFDVTLVERGPQVFKYTIFSDISQRNIRGYQNSDTYKTFVVVCRGVAPTIDIKKESIDFGNVVYSSSIGEDCPSKKDTVVRISNRGNSDLIIRQFELPANSYFSVKPLDMILKAGSDSSITITFNSDYPAKLHNDTLKLHTNCAAPNDMISIPLVAWSVPPVIGDLSIRKNMRSKSGSIINIPILIRNDNYKPAIYANAFETKLIFNPTLLQYDNRGTIGTAAEGAYVDVDYSERGSITLKITGQDYFFARDTLINLKFKVFLGDNISTEIAFIEPKFSNGNCTGVIDAQPDNGSLILDSICGLEYKAVPYAEGRIVVTGITPNPSNEVVKLGISLPFNVLTEIALFDSYGNKVKELAHDVLPSGAYEFQAQVSDLPVGVYVCRISVGLHNENQTFVITR